ncbi:MAG: thioredoxin-like domain-containing protein [Gemmatimonadaceae bacterium]|nr:thioredoxin-like domain-containing protein [Gemmatimonadaceae bacterium]
MHLAPRHRPVQSLALLAVALCGARGAIAQSAPDSTIVTGVVTGFDGRVPRRADVELVPIRATSLARRVRADERGMFRVAVAGSGPFRLRAGGIGYLSFERALPVTTPTTLSVAVTLAGLPAGLARGPLIGVSSENDAEKPRPDMPPAVLLTPAGQGIRAGVLRARRDTVAYRVVDITARTYLPPSGASAFRWADDGEYEGLAIGTAGKDVRLIYDSSLVSVGGSSSFRIVGAHPVASVVAQLDSIFAFGSGRRCLVAAQAPPIDPADAVMRDTSLTEQLRMIRRLLRADAECQVHPRLGAAVVELFTPTARLWQLDDVMRRRVLLLAARQAVGLPRVNTTDALEVVRARFDASIAAAPDTAARFDLYVAAAETFMPADTVSAQRYTARFVAESYDHPRLLPLLRLTGYNRVLQPGRMVRAFRVSSMDSSGALISDVSLRGTVYLLDVWATWCRDCIVELPALRSLHERFAMRGLTLLSVSVDEEQGTADQFRRVREPMPWTHAWAGVWPEREGPLAGLEVTWLPTTILVGRDGRILALAPKLESAEFAALIEAALK